MKELQSILSAYRDITRVAAPAALATVVKTEGSAYRRPGARMLVRDDGSRVGAISGGCLEADVVERAKQVIATGVSQFVRYDARGSNGDLIFEAGCDGAIGILIEPIDRAARALDYIAHCMDARKSGAMATVFQAGGEWSETIGARVTVDSDGVISSDIDDPELVLAIQYNAWEAMKDGVRRTCVHETPKGVQEILIEPIEPPVALVICGAAPGSIPLARLAAQMGWRVTIADTRADTIDPETVPDAALVTAPRLNLLNAVTIDARTAAVVMTHNYEWDLALLTHLLPSPARYVGLLGSRKRAARVSGDLLDARLALTSRQQDRFHSPAGLDIGSETPEEIALSIIAEIQAAMSDRAGGALRDRREPIHSFETKGELLVANRPAGQDHACAR
ncbi:hypothetical protein CCAX7_008270 [Capsulimonas corticalis]|uniref:Uncharacterized protein n=1 Tax=Capsulimonas corticalis TaxID=2219043 RepID=A0A402CTX7_9BACT|nr:XdhC/CoxI family protein [Capsulimonas corticalis]BDI28776.1 hypothetical protein CCAX7_008270 [Capsulimonas corticalis]